MNGIIVASFGTSFKEVREKSIGKVEEAITLAFPDYQVRRSFTSNMIIKKLKERDGIFIDTPMIALDRMIGEGFRNIHVQPLHVIPGFEYEKVLKAVKMANHNKLVNVTIGLPLLSEEAHYDQVVDAVFKELNPSDPSNAFVLMGHGTEHHANACYSMLQAKINDRISNVFVSNVEGYPNLEHVESKLDKYKNVTLMPLMIVAGDHAMNDMAGDDASYKSILEASGKSVTCLLKGLGELTSIHEIFVRRIKESIG